MKFLFLLVFIFAFCLLGFGQTKPPAKTFSIASIRTGIAIKKLQREKKNLEQQLELLKSKYNDKYFAVIETKESIKVIDSQISQLNSTPLSNNVVEILEEEIPTDDLLKILAIQNQKIIELLEKIANKK